MAEITQEQENLIALEGESSELRVTLEGAELLFKLTEEEINNREWLEKNVWTWTNTIRILINEALRRLDRLDEAELKIRPVINQGQWQEGPQL